MHFRLKPWDEKIPSCGFPSTLQFDVTILWPAPYERNQIFLRARSYCLGGISKVSLLLHAWQRRWPHIIPSQYPVISFNLTEHSLNPFSDRGSSMAVWDRRSSQNRNSIPRLVLPVDDHIASTPFSDTYGRIKLLFSNTHCRHSLRPGSAIKGSLFVIRSSPWRVLASPSSLADNMLIDSRIFLAMKLRFQIE